MATGRTISASFLTDFDKKVIELCEKISYKIAIYTYSLNYLILLYNI